jgi:orotate phosphoribosyltransferase
MKYKNKQIQAVRDIINTECIVRVPSGSKELPALGGKGYYTWQFYLRRALLDPFCLKVICNDFWNKNTELFKQQSFQLAGVESAAVPLITALILSGERRGYKVNAFTIRKARKEYGKRNFVEGNPSTEPVLFIDDLTSSEHNAFWHAIHVIGQEKLMLCSIGYVLVLKNKEEESRIIKTSLGNVTIQSLFNLNDFALTFDEFHNTL